MKGPWGVLHLQQLIVCLPSLAQRCQCRHWRRGPRILQPIHAGVATSLWPFRSCAEPSCAAIVDRWRNAQILCFLIGSRWQGLLLSTPFCDAGHQEEPSCQDESAVQVSESVITALARLKFESDVVRVNKNNNLQIK